MSCSYAHMLALVAQLSCEYFVSIKDSVHQATYSRVLMNKEQLISEMLLLPAAAIDYHLSQHLLQLFPDKAFIESEGYFNVEGYAQAQQCMLTRKTYSYNQMNTYWQGPEPQLLHPHHMGLQMGGVIINGMNPFPALTAPPTQNAASETHDAVNKSWIEVQWQVQTLQLPVLQVPGDAFHHSDFRLLADTYAVVG